MLIVWIRSCFLSTPWKSNVKWTQKRSVVVDLSKLLQRREQLYTVAGDGPWLVTLLEVLLYVFFLQIFHSSYCLIQFSPALWSFRFHERLRFGRIWLFQSYMGSELYCLNSWSCRVHHCRCTSGCCKDAYSECQLWEQGRRVHCREGIGQEWRNGRVFQGINTKGLFIICSLHFFFDCLFSLSRYWSLALNWSSVTRWHSPWFHYSLNMFRLDFVGWERERYRRIAIPDHKSRGWRHIH